MGEVAKELMVEVLEMKGDMKVMASSVERLVAAVEKIETVKMESHEKRIAFLEKKYSELKGIMIASGAILAILEFIFKVYK